MKSHHDHDKQNQSIQNRTDDSPAYSQFLQKNRERLSKLGASLSEEYNKTHRVDQSTLQEWLQLNSVINMHKVCDAFYRGSLFYETDLYHPACEEKLDKKYSSLTTVSQLHPIICVNDSKNCLVDGSYLVNHAYMSPAQTLHELLFSYTYLDCTGSMGVANYLTLLDLLKVIHGESLGTVRFLRRGNPVFLYSKPFFN